MALTFKTVMSGVAQSMPQVINSWYQMQQMQMEYALESRRTEAQAGYYESLTRREDAETNRLEELLPFEARTAQLTADTADLTNQAAVFDLQHAPEKFDKQMDLIDSQIIEARNTGRAALLNAESNATRAATEASLAKVERIGAVTDLMNTFVLSARPGFEPIATSVTEKMIGEGTIDPIAWSAEMTKQLGDAGWRLTPREQKTIETIGQLQGGAMNLLMSRVEEQVSTEYQRLQELNDNDLGNIRMPTVDPDTGEMTEVPLTRLMIPRYIDLFRQSVLASSNANDVAGSIADGDEAMRQEVLRLIGAPEPQEKAEPTETEGRQGAVDHVPYLNQFNMLLNQIGLRPIGRDTMHLNPYGKGAEL